MSGSGLDLCESCPKGTYQERKYQDTCIPCLEGLTTIGTGSRERSDCYGKTLCCTLLFEL